MDRFLPLKSPWLVAVWPGMGQIALNAGVYLLSKLEMNMVVELETGNLFDIDHVMVKDGLIQASRRPRSRLFCWRDPKGQHDLLLFIGEAQPPIGKYAFCQQIISHAVRLGVERVYTFAAMATQMHPEHPSRVFLAATDAEALKEMKQLKPDVLEDGQIGGLNGLLLGAAAEAGVKGVCLLGEMPHIFSQLPYPKASLAILEIFAPLLGIELDLTALSDQATSMDEQLGALLARVEKAYQERYSAVEEKEFAADPESKGLDPEDERKIEQLFEESASNRKKAFELKQELDRLGLFKDYEDRFLDLFTTPE